jgi:ribonuclease HI
VTGMAEKPKFYVVWKGRKPGVYSSWKACEAQVQGFPGAQYKSFGSRTAAEQALRGKFSIQTGKPATSGDWLFAPHPPLADSIVVDAACSGSPGRLEFRGVDLRSGREIFREGPFRNGTNNVGEFLAIVHALELLKIKKSDLPVYSDSETAIIWVKARHCNTRLAADKSNAALFVLIDRAEEWLAEQKKTNPVLKWDTRAWGEIPADFNRK